MSTATSGRAREHRVALYMRGRGWRKIMRAAGSKGSADLLMAHPQHGAALVQVGTARSKTLGPLDRARFLRDAEWCGALALLVTVEHRPGKPSEFVCWQVTIETPSKWGRWEL